MRKQNGLISAIHYGVMIILLVLTLFPFYMTLVNSLKNRRDEIRNFWGLPRVFQWDNYSDAAVFLWPFIVNSLIVTGSIVAGVLVISTMAAYSFSRFQFPGKEFLFFLIIMLYMIPGFLLLVPQFIFIKNMGLLNTYLGQIFPPMALGATMATLLVREFFNNIPNSLFEAAQIEGAGEFLIFFKVAVPLSYPIISVVAIWNTITGWNNYIWPLVITSGDAVKPVILALGRIPGSIEQGLGLQLAGYVIASLPLILLFIFATRTFITGLTSGSVKG